MGGFFYKNCSVELFCSGLILQMVLKKGQLQPIKAAVPVEVGIGANAQQRRATCSFSK